MAEPLHYFSFQLTDSIVVEVVIIKFPFSIAAPVTNHPVTPKALTAGQNKPHPSHIPSHFPEFPDPHTYIKTPVSLI